MRTETEQETIPGIERSEHITIPDPIQHVVIHLDPRTKTATVTPMAQSGLVKDSLPQSAPKTEPLGTKVIEGFVATGTKTTLETTGELLPNGQPTVSVTEAWFSPELQITLSSQTSDNQQGRDTMKVVNIVRSEPDSQLFQIPAGYAVKQSVLATASAKH